MTDTQFSNLNQALTKLKAACRLVEDSTLERKAVYYEGVVKAERERRLREAAK